MDLSESGDFNKTDQNTAWIIQQKKTFTRWANTFLLQRSIRVVDVQKELDNGLVLINLLELISGKKITRYNKNPKIKAQKVENTEIALKFIQDERIKLVGIGATDLVEGNLKLILGLLWTLILRYHIQKGREDASKNALLDWVNSKLTKRKVKEFQGSWSDGMAINELMESLRPDLVDLQKVETQTPLERVTDAENAAEAEMEIPQVIQPEEFVSPDVDPLSMMTYISYFRDYEDKMIKLAEEAALNETVDPTKCSMEGPGLKGGMVGFPAEFKIIGKNSRGVQVPRGGHPFIVKIDGPEGEDIDAELKDNNDGTFDVTYTPKNQGKHKVNAYLETTPLPKSPVMVKIDPARAVPQFSFADGPGVTEALAGAPVDFTVHGINLRNEPCTAGGDNFQVEVKDCAGNKVPCDLKDNEDGTYTGTYEPRFGDMKIDIKVDDQPIKDSPYTAKIGRDPSRACPENTFAHGPGVEDKAFNTYDDGEFVIDGVTPDGTPPKPCEKGGEKFNITITDPEGNEIPCKIEDTNDGHYPVKYHTNKSGKHKIAINLVHPTDEKKDDPIKGSVYEVDVLPGFDPEKSKVYGPGVKVAGPGATSDQKLNDCDDAPFVVEPRDCNGDKMTADQVKDLPIKITVEGPDGNEIPVEVKPNPDGSLDCNYKPTDQGKHRIKVKLNDEDLADSPYEVEVEEGVSDENTGVDTFNFTILARTRRGSPHTEGSAKFTVEVHGPDGPLTQEFPPYVRYLGEGKFFVSYKLPAEKGDYKIHCKINKRDIIGSPLRQKM